MPAWAVEKLAALRKTMEKAVTHGAGRDSGKQSVLAKLETAKRDAGRDNPAPEKRQNKGQEL
jgi:hypothetical protein